MDEGEKAELVKRIDLKALKEEAKARGDRVRALPYEDLHREAPPG